MSNRGSESKGSMKVGAGTIVTYALAGILTVYTGASFFSTATYETASFCEELAYPCSQGSCGELLRVVVWNSGWEPQTGIKVMLHTKTLPLIHDSLSVRRAGKVPVTASVVEEDEQTVVSLPVLAPGHSLEVGGLFLYKGEGKRPTCDDFLRRVEPPQGKLVEGYGPSLTFLRFLFALGTSWW